MTGILNARILASVAMLVFVGAVVAGSTGAFFSDTETSTGNTFTAGALDLKVDSQSHFNGLVCRIGAQNEVNPGVLGWHHPTDDSLVGPEHFPQPGDPCTGTWAESDLIADSLAFRFFNFDDLKPGDEGENTISLHVLDNDAWGCFTVDNVVDSDVTCTEPESEDVDDLSCTPNGNVAVGELGAALTFDAWLDEGTTPGFQCNNPDVPATAGASCDADPEEGDNILNGVEQLFWDDETVDEASEGPFAMSNVLSTAYALHQCTDATGHTEYGLCHGLALDGRMVGSATYYWGLAWSIPGTAGNEIQTDSLTLDMIFEAVQHRNNPDFQCTPPEVRTTLTLAKTVIPAEQEPDSSYTLIADGAVTDLSGIEGSPAVFFAPVEPGVYALSESGGDPDPTSVTWSCTGNATPEVDNGNGTASVTVGPGENVVCVVENNYEAAPPPVGP
ncbi:MAG: TasA family protein [Patescibacteria group bacterium]